MKKFLPILFIIISFSCQEKESTLFTKLSSEYSGIEFNNKIIETDSFNILTSEYIFNGGGVAVGDFNNDELPDVFFTGNQVANKLYLNQGELKFNDVSKKAGIEAETSWNTGVALIDINNDNLLDIYLCAAMLPTEKERMNKLFVNQGLDNNGVPSFIEMADKYGIADNGNSMAATFFDYDKDGLLDLYVLNNVDIHVLPANYREKITDGSALSNDRLYRNNGDGTFTDVTLEAGITIEGYGLGLAISDMNYDGWPDIYVSNDYLTNDVLYINNQDGTFSNKIPEYVKHQSKFSMGNDISDYNNDGLLDIITLDMVGETNHRLKTTIMNTKYTSYILNDKYGYEYQYSRNMLHKGNGLGIPSSEIGLMAGVAKTDWSWSPLFADMDNDGFKDLLITNGFPRDITDLDFGEFRFNVSRYLSPGDMLDSIPSVKIPNYAFKYDGESRFKDVGKEWGLNIPSFSNGAAFADFDNDGDLDYVVNNINDPAFLFRNNLSGSNQNNYLKVDLVGPGSNPLGIGAKVVARLADGTFQYHEHYLGRGYMSHVQDIVHFGLGSFQEVETLEVLWPDGKFQQYSSVNGNQEVIFDYQNASPISRDALHFPLIPALKTKLFKEVTQAAGVNYVHKEQDIVDYNLQRVLPHKLTQNGPCLTSGDINGDGFEDFIVGSSSGHSPNIFFQGAAGNFRMVELFTDEESKKFEEEGMVLFDLENDGDLDLYLVSGSNEFRDDGILYKDRLLINDGNGNFELATDELPGISSSGSVVVANDFDGDGFVDLFIGGRTPIGNYPIPDKSFLLKNSNGKLVDVTDSHAKGLRTIGMVTDAKWADIDSDGLEDLVIVGEYMPITIFRNNKSHFEKLSNTGIDSLLGWWESIESADFDNDGDVDFVVGNIGANNLYQPSRERPATIVARDLDSNGTIDPVMFAYFKENLEDDAYHPYPVNFWADLYSQSPLFRAKFNSFEDYAKATQSTLLTQEELDGALKFIGNYDRSIYLENLGKGKFRHRELAWEVQVAPIQAAIVTDYDKDGNSDIVLIGNDYGNEVFIGRYDAFNGAVLKGDGTGHFKVISTEESGFLIRGDAKDIISVTNAEDNTAYFVVSQNRDSLKIYKN